MKKRLAAAAGSAIMAVGAACPILAAENDLAAVQTGDATQTLLIIAGVVVLVAVVALILTNVLLKKK